ncbi:MAG: hypothetical protein HYX39_04965 [Bacteroidetes bacterium]|nr:hypothetical protein [Bacteroidota bacterium]
MKDQPHHKDLKDLLNSIKNKSSQDLDDFDREAIEGFESLESNQEALDLKNELDTKIHDQLFTPKKKNEKVYWFAAAGLFMVISLSVFFILNGNSHLQEKDVAQIPEKIINIEKEKALSAPTSEAVEPVVRKVPDAEKSKSKNIEPSDKDKRVSLRALLKPSEAGSGQGEVSSVLQEKADDAEAAAIKESDKPISKSSSEEVNFSGKLKNTDEKEQNDLNADKQTSSSANGELNEFKKSENDEFKKESVYKGRLARKKQNASKNKSKNDPSQDPKTLNPSTVLNSTDSRAKENKEGDGITQPKSAPAQSEPGKSKTEYFNSPSNTIYFAGGEDALAKEIRVKLIEKKVDKRFDAILIINENKKIEEVTYINPYELSTEEKNKVTEVLKTLTNFNFYIQPNTKGLFEYKVNYRP